LQKQFAKYIILLLLSVVLTGFTFVLGAIPIRVLRRGFSRQSYWFGLAAMAILSFIFLSQPLAVALALLTSLIGLYTDAEEAGSGFFASGFFASVTTSSFALVAAAFWASKKKLNLVQIAQSNVEQVLAQIKSINPQINWTTESFLYQVPSAFVIFLLVSLAVALIWDKKLGNLLQMNLWVRTSRSLLNFKVPDLLVWVAIVSVASAFGQHKYVLLQNIFLNVVNVLALIYFFQGIAIAKHFFMLNRVSKFWQAFSFFFMLFQLFPLVSLLGFSDYWVNYRSRWTKLPKQTDTQFKSGN